MAFPWERDVKTKWGTEPAFIVGLGPDISDRRFLESGPGIVSINRWNPNRQTWYHYVSVNRNFHYPLKIALIGNGPLALMADFDRQSNALNFWILDLTPPPLEFTMELVQPNDQPFPAYQLAASISLNQEEIPALKGGIDVYRLYSEMVFCWGATCPEFLVSLTPALTDGSIHRVIITDPELIELIRQKAWSNPRRPRPVEKLPDSGDYTDEEFYRYASIKEKFYGQQIDTAAVPLSGMFDFSRNTDSVTLDRLCSSDGRMIERVRVLRVSLDGLKSEAEIIANGKSVKVPFDKFSVESQEALRELCKSQKNAARIGKLKKGAAIPLERKSEK